MNVGDRCDDIKLGDRVCSVGLAIGGNAKYAILPSSRVFCCPEDIEPTTVACIARNYMTAYQCLHRAGGMKIRPGNKVLIIGGAGALGQALIQLAIAAGADEVYATGKGSNSKRIIENLGAQSLGRKTGEWLPYVKGQMDIVVDSVCADDFVSSQRALNRTGKLVCVGCTAISKKSYNWNSGLDPSQRFYVVELASSMPKTSFFDIFSSLEMKRDIFRKDLFRLFHLCRNHEITPKVAFCITLNEVANAHLDLEAGGVDGTIVCLPFGPEGNKTDVKETGQDQITVYDDGIEVHQSLIGGTLPSMFGKVMKDGTFKELDKKREEYDDDLYSMAGGIQRTASHGGIKRVDSTPFGFQDDMEQSLYRGMRDEENDDSDSRISAYKSKSRKPSKYDDDNYSRSGRQAIPRPRPNSSRRDARDDPDEYFGSERNRRESSRGYGGHYDDVRGNSRNSSRRTPVRDDDDDARSVRSRKDSTVLRGRDYDDDDDDDIRSTRSRSKKRSSSRKNITRDMLDEVDDYGSVGKPHSRGGHSRTEPVDDIKRTTSILRNNKNGSFSNRSASRGASSRHAGSNREYESSGTSSRYGHSHGGPDSPGNSSRHARPSSRGSVRPSSRVSARPSSRGSVRPSSRGQRSSSQPIISRARSRSRDPEARRDIQRGRARSRSLDSRVGRSRSPSNESVYSQGTQGTHGSQRSRASQISAYTQESEGNRDDVSVPFSVASEETEYTPPEPEIKEKEPSSRRKIKTKTIAEVPKAAINKRATGRKGLLSRFRSSSRQRIKEQLVVPISTKPKIKQRVESKSSPKPRVVSRTTGRDSRSGSKIRGDRKKERATREDRDRRKTKESGRDRQRMGSGGKHGYDDADAQSVVSDDIYEEEATRSVVSLNCASDDSMESDLVEVDPIPPPRESSRPRSSKAAERPRSALKQHSSRPRSAMRPSSGTSRPSSRLPSSRPSSSRPSSSSRQFSSRAPPSRSSSRTSRGSSSRRDVYDDGDYS